EDLLKAPPAALRARTQHRELVGAHRVVGLESRPRLRFDPCDVGGHALARLDAYLLRRVLACPPPSRLGVRGDARLLGGALPVFRLAALAESSRARPDALGFLLADALLFDLRELSQ